MLQEKIKDLQSSLKKYSQNLAKKNQLVDIPWTMVDGDLNLQRLIFKKDNSLYIVKEGEINESKWEYLSELDSLVIVLGGKKIVMNEIYSDTKALILKKDGTNLDFLTFANHKELPSLNLFEYFENLLQPKILPTQKVIEVSSKQKKAKLWVMIVFVLIMVITAILIDIFI